MLEGSVVLIDSDFGHWPPSPEYSDEEEGEE